MKSFRVKSIYAATTVALGLSSSVALAFVSGNGVYEVRMSGATASTDMVRNLLIDNACNTGTIDVFRTFSTSTSTFGNDWSVKCNVNATAINAVVGGSTVTAQDVHFRKNDTGGSGEGVTPVTQQLAVNFLVAETSNCSSSATASTGGGTVYNLWKCGTTTTPLAPDAGFSDLEPAMFTGLNKPAGRSDYVKTGPGVFAHEIRSLAQLVFNVPVTLQLRNALQAAQGLMIGSDNKANMPSLSSQAIRSILTGKLSSWDDLQAWNGAAYVRLQDHPAVLAADKPGNNVVHICRRVPGSGTQAQAQALFLGTNCTNDVLVPATPSAFGVSRVINNSGSSDVDVCLHDKNNGTSSTRADNTPTATNSDLLKHWAVGVQSTERNPTLSRNYRFIKIDGAAPDLQDTHAGFYYDWAEQSMQWRSDANTFAAGAANGAKAQKIVDYISKTAVSKTAVTELNLNFNHSGGWQGGWLLNPGSGSPAATPDVNFVATNPVSNFTRTPQAKAPNTCQMPVMDNGLSVASTAHANVKP